MSPAIAGLPE
jgi:hypothetical protein